MSQNNDENPTDILDELEQLIYIADVKTCDLLYVNPYSRKKFNLGDYHGKKCYEYLQGLDHICPFCTNCFLKKGEVYRWNYFNPLLGASFQLEDKLIRFQGRDARLEIAFDTTDLKNKQNELKNILDSENKMVDVIQKLNESDPLEDRLNSILQEIGNYFEADRAYIFEIDAGGKTLSNTFEWCREGVIPQMEHLQHGNIHLIDRWMSFFDRKSAVVVPDIEAVRSANPDEFAIMAEQDISSYVEAPIEINEKFTGFVGLDNPKAEKVIHAGEQLLTVAYSISNAMQKETADRKLREQSQRLQTIINNIPVGISVIQTRNGQIVSRMGNSVLYDLMKIPYDEKFTEQILEHVPVNDSCVLNANLAELMRNETDKRVVYQYRSNEKEEPRWFKMVSRSVRYDEEMVIFSSLSDITAEKEAEAELLKSRRMYEAAAELAGLAVWTYDIPAHRIILADNAATNQDRSTFDIPKVIENMPEASAEWVDEKDFPNLMKAYRDIEQGVPSVVCEYWYKTRLNVQPKCEKMIYTTIFDDLGKPVSAIGVGQDITAQKLDEEKYNRMYQQLSRVNPYSMGSFRLNLTRNLCGDGQSPYDSILAQQKDGTVDGYLEANSSIIADEKIKSVFCQEFTREKMMEAFRSGKTELKIEYPVWSSKREIIWIDAFVNMVQNPKTRDIEAVTYALNVTDRKNEENIVSRISEEKFDHIGLINPSSRTYELLRKNWKFGKMEPNQKKDYDLVVKDIADHFVVPEDRELFLKNTGLDKLAAAMGKDNNYTFVFRCLDEEGKVSRKRVEYVWMDESKNILINVQTDITEVYQQEQEQLRQVQEALKAAKTANKAKTDFISRISHDIRTPLSAITSMIAFAKEDLDDREKLTNDLNKIETSNTFLLSLINDILDISKIDSGKIELHPEPYPYEEYEANICNMFGPMCEQKGINFQIRHGDIKGTILVDKVRLNQILLNLLSNAVKYTPSGGEIMISSCSEFLPEDSSHIRVIFDVKDTGIGMSEDFQKIMFEPFSQEYSNPNRPVDMIGSGLGLSLVKRIIDLMGGTITVKSEVGKGSEFSVLFVFPKAEEADLKKKNLDSKSWADERLTGTVLLAEDNVINTEIALRLLSGFGLEIMTVRNGQEALTAFEQSEPGKFAAVLLDIQMPVMDGYETAEKIRSSSHPDAKNIPIIAMTANAFSDAKEQCLKIGMNGYVTKPLNRQALFEELKKLIG